MRRFLFLSLMLVMLLPGYLYSQTQLRLSGTVADSSKPLSLVTIRIFKQNSPTPFQTTLSKDDGSFQFNKPTEGKYTLSFTHTGFAEKQLTINITAAAGDMQIDPVQLSRATAMLKEVVVKTQRPLVEQLDDKIVFNVEDDPGTKSETALDILRKTPFVSVDGQDNIQVNGKTNFKVLLNGRETSMFSNNLKDALRGFPGALISRIEVITTPSAKYDGEGIGGLINIITKKKVAGYNGTISAFGRSSDQVGNVAINGNAKFGKIGASLFFVTGGSNPVPLHNNNITIPADPLAYTKRTLDGAQQSSGAWNFGNAEINWELDSLNTWTLYANSNGNSNNLMSDQTITTDFKNAPSSISNYSFDSHTNNPGISVGSDYIKKFRNNKDREFSLRFLGDFSKSDSYLNSSQDNPDRFLINNSNAINDQYTLQADNIIPTSKGGRIEAGAKAILRHATSDFASLVKYDAAASYKPNPLNSDQFKYNQDVISFYALYNIKFKKSSFRLGTRVEYTNVDGDFISSATQVKHSYTTLLPNIQFTQKLGSVITMILSYNKRLSRPFITDLNPFVNNNDSLNISYGNPNLGPQTIHVISAQFRYGKGKTFGGINFDGSYSDNKILQYSSFDAQSGITKTTSLNIGKEFQSSVNINLSTSLSNKLSFFSNGSLRYSNITNNTNTSQTNSGFGVNFITNTTYKFSPKFSISNFLGFWKDPVSIQTTYPLTFWYNLAFNIKMLKDKFSVSLRAVNFFEKDHDYKTVITDPNFTTTNINTQIRRAAAIALTWNFGKLTENVSKKKGVNNDDLLTKQQPTTGN